MNRSDAIKIVQKEIDEIMKKITKRFLKSLDSYVYGRTMSQYYNPRTMQLRNAFKRPKVSISPSGILKIEVLDYSIIKQHKGINGQFNRHMSLDGSKSYDETNIRYLIPIWQNEGYRLPNGGSIAPTHYIENAFSDYEGSPQNFFEEELKKFIRKVLNIKNKS